MERAASSANHDYNSGAMAGLMRNSRWSPHIHSSQAPVASLVGNCADHLPAPDTCVPGPGPHPLSPASFPPGSSARFQRNTPVSSRRSSGRERDSRSTIFPTRMTRSCRLKVTQVKTPRFLVQFLFSASVFHHSLAVVNRPHTFEGVESCVPGPPKVSTAVSKIVCQR